MENNQKPNHIDNTNKNRLWELAVDYLKDQISKQTNISKDRIRNRDSLDRYGIDSVAIMSMTKAMESDLGKLSKTLFFEYNTVDELAKYLFDNKHTELAKLFGADAGETSVPEKKSDVKSAAGIGKLGIIKKKDSSVPQKPVKKAVKKGKPNLAVINNQFDDDIAIVGVAGKYPMADDIDEFWDNLKNGRDCVTEIPDKRWDNSVYYSDKKGDIGKTYAKWGGFLNDVEMFDPLFFNMTPLEADFTDPQERLFLETTWKAFEEAGYSKEELSNKNVGVFVGVMFGLYQLLETYDYGAKMTGRCNFASIANRVSYFYNFHGPSIALDTMCSSSLTALHLACNSIKNGESEMAVVGGVNLILHPNKYVQLSQGGFLSTDGKCRSFGSGGDGYVPGEGVGAIVIKPLKKAVADGNHIYALIKSTAVNAGGKTNGYTVPNPAAQTDVIKTALKEAGISARTISYIEAHGTGTKLGDPIEVTGMTNAYRDYTDDNGYCAVGSVKSNVGHLESAAGVAAITKVILQMKNKSLAPSIHSRHLNEFIDFEDTPFYVQRELGEWKRPIVETDGKEVEYPRRAGISAFGAGGANAHIIIEEYCNDDAVKINNEKKPRLFVLSAKTEDCLESYAQEMLDFVCRYTGSDELQKDKQNALGTDDFADIIKNAAGSVLGIKPSVISEDDYFCDLGLDRYQLSSFCDIIKGKTDKPISIDFITLQPTVHKLAEHLSEKPETKTEVNHKDVDLDLDDFAYTLQLGRSEMEERLAIIASDVWELRDLLYDYLNGKSNGSIFCGNTNNYTEQFDEFVKSDSGVEYADKLLADKDYNKIAELWISGVSFDWNKLYSHKMNRLSLPTYPFAKVRCWVTENTESGRLVEEQFLPVNRVKSALPNFVPHNSGNVETKNITDAELRNMVVEYLKQAFSAVLKIPVEQLQENVDFEAYGLDSIYINQLNTYFENYFGKLPSSLLFTYKNLKSLSKYFVKEQREKVLNVLFGTENNYAVSDSSSADDRVVQVESYPQYNGNEDDDIAIIGISGQYPQSKDLDEYLDNLLNGKDLITEIPPERWDYRDYPEVKCKWGGFISDADKFDPQFFNITPNNAKYMDPQERILLEKVWSCLEDSGYSPKSLCSDDEDDTRGNVAVYVGVSFNTYGLNGVEDKSMPINTQLYSVANRISYVLNLKGPSLAVDTACSSSLYAIHMGCESIIHGECDMAIAGGVNLSLHPSKYVTLNWGGFLASDGHCRSFGEGGDGYVPGEGVGAILLKPLKKAIADNDHIYGVIKGTAVNHGGKTNGYSVPNPVAQSEVIRKALGKAKINPSTISYIEAHGTGTSLGDPIEIDALTDVFKKYTDKKQYCAIGSVKSNAGHLEAAAGIAQITKVLMQFKSDTIFPSRLNSDSLNHNIHFEDTSFYVQTSAQKWVVDNNLENPEGLMRAGVSSFGVGGVNVHIVLEEYREPEREKAVKSETTLLIPLSALSSEALERNVKQLRTFLEAESLPDIRDFAYTLQVGRIELAYRVAFAVHSYDELKSVLDKYINNDYKDDKRIFAAKAKSIVDCPDNNTPFIINNALDETILSAAQYWINGKLIDYSNLYVEYEPHRVSLPTYSFEKESYWLYEKKVSKATDETETSESASDETSDILTDDAQSESVDGSQAGGIDQEFIESIMDMPLSERMENMVSYIQDVFSELLGFAEGRLPDPDQGFFELGLESIETTRAYNRLTEIFGLELDMQLFFNYPNINKLSDYILELLEEQESAEQLDDTEEEQAEKSIGAVYFNDSWIPVVQENNRVSIDDVLVFTNDRAMFNAVKSADGNVSVGRAIQVRQGKKFGYNSKNSSLTVADENSYNMLFSTLEDKEIKVENIVYLWDFAKSQDEAGDEKSVINKLYDTILCVMKSLMNTKNKCNFVFAFNSENTVIPEKEAVIGLFKTVQIENPAISCKLVEFTDSNADCTSVANTLLQELTYVGGGLSVRYSEGQRYESQLQEIKSNDSNAIQLRSDGVYVVTNFDGVLGLLIARYLSNTKNCNVIVAGNRDLSDDEQAYISNSAIGDGSTINYINANLTDYSLASRFVEKVHSEYGNINGVIHTAESARDNKIYMKDLLYSEQIISENLVSAINLDAVLNDEKLDFFMLISSFITLLGYTGQSDYCYTSQYLKSFADYRNTLCGDKKRFGKSVSVLWPFYKESNVLSGAETEKWFEKSFGISPLDSEQGQEICDTLFKFDYDSIGIMYGDIDKIRTLFGFAANDVYEYFDDSNADSEDDDAIDEELNDMSEDELADMLKSMLEED